MKSFGRRTMNITEVGIVRLSHDNSCIQTDPTLSRQAAKEDFIYLPVSFVWIAHALYLSLFPVCKISLKRRGCLLNHQFQRVPFLFCQPPGYFYPPPANLPVPPPIHSFPRELSVPICTLLVTLSTYLVPTECLCNQTNTYPVVRHSNGRLIMKLLHCELTTG